MVICVKFLWGTITEAASINIKFLIWTGKVNAINKNFICEKLSYAWLFALLFESYYDQIGGYTLHWSLYDIQCKKKHWLHTYTVLSGHSDYVSIFFKETKGIRNIFWLVIYFNTGISHQHTCIYTIHILYEHLISVTFDRFTMTIPHTNTSLTWFVWYYLHHMNNRTLVNGYIKTAYLFDSCLYIDSTYIKFTDSNMPV